MKSLNILITTMLLLFLLTSCSKSSNPLTPDQMGDNSSDVNPIVVADSQMQVNPYRGVFGAWEVNLDVENLTAEIIPSRNARAIGDIFDADLLQFLTVSPCANCMRISRIAFNDMWLLELDVGIKHPFDNITTRPDLHGFDVRLIFIYGGLYSDVLDGIDVMLPDGSEVPADLHVNNLVNADGYTSHFDSIVTDERYFLGGSDATGNINPFLRYFTDNATTEFDPHVPSGQNVLPVGSEFETRTAYLGNWGYEGLKLYLVADVAYGQSATYLNRPDPQYYLPEFHRTEPWRIEYWNENNNIDSMIPTSTADVVVQVFDWQHGATVDPDYPNPDNLSGISQSSNVLQLELLMPGFQDDPIIVDTPESGTGTPQDPLTYRLQVTNERTSNSSCTGLLAVRDELYGQTGRLPIPESVNGFPYDTEDILDYTLYHIICVNNPTSPFYTEVDYDGELNIQDDDLHARYGNTTIRPYFFMDPGGARFQYRWDYDYDGITFDDDGEGVPSPVIEFTTGGVHNVGLRIRTNSVPPREYLYSIPITVNGTVFQGDIDSTVMEMKDCMSYNRSASISGSSGYYYCAFTSESGTKRDVWLAVYDSATGLFTSSNLTQALSVNCFHPAITVIKDGTHDRLVVVFNIVDGLGEWHLYSTWGNLDGSNFLGAHITPLGTTRVINAFVDTVFQYGEVFAYYWSTPNPFIEGNIEIAYSSDYGETWNIHPTLIDGGSNQKFEPVVVYSTREPRTYVIWEDCRDSVTNGTDLYIARSYLGRDFEPAVNISNFVGDVDEQEPEAVAHGSKIAITYLADPNGAGNSEVWVKLMDVYDELYVDFQVGFASPTVDCLRPAIGMAVDNKIALAYLSYDTVSEELTSWVREIEAENGFFDLRINTLYNESAGSIAPSAISYVYGSGVVCRSLLGDDAYETFAVWTGYNNGSAHDVTPFTMYFGDIECISVISDGEE